MVFPRRCLVLMGILMAHLPAMASTLSPPRSQELARCARLQQIVQAIEEWREKNHRILADIEEHGWNQRTFSPAFPAMGDGVKHYNGLKAAAGISEWNPAVESVERFLGDLKQAIISPLQARVIVQRGLPRLEGIVDNLVDKIQRQDETCNLASNQRALTSDRAVEGRQ